jgi:drug/metabolite transporter (DMT)-like permease
MVSGRALVLVIIAAMIYSVHLYATYHPKIRASTSVWAIGIGCTVLADVLWIMVTRDLNDNTLIAHYAFVWEIAYKLIAVAIPVLLFNVQLTSVGYVGIALIIFGGFCLKWGGSAV